MTIKTSHHTNVLNHHQSTYQNIKTTLTYKSNILEASEDESVLTHPFKTADYNDDERLRTGLFVSTNGDNIVQEAVLEFTNDHQVS